MPTPILHGAARALAGVSALLLASCAAQGGSRAARAEGAVTIGAVSRPQQALDSLLTIVLREHGSPALAVAVVRGDSLIAAGVVGVRSTATGEPVRLHDRFHLGSVAKPVSTTLIALLVERRLLAWSTTPAEIFPEMEAAIDPSLRTITLTQLLAHTSGLPNYNPGTPEWNALPVLNGSATTQRAAFARWVLSRPAERSPGSGFLYSNAGAPIAAAMAERVTGRSWEELLRELVFTPLGLETAGFGWPATDDPRQPWGHGEEDGVLQPHDPRGDYRIPLWMRPAGDIHMSVVDLARFAAVHARGPSGSTALLSPQSLREMHTPLVARTTTIDHALGWHVWSEASGRRAGRSFHAGGGGTFIAFVEVAPALELGFVIMINDGREPSPSLTAIRNGLDAIFSAGP